MCWLLDVFGLVWWYWLQLCGNYPFAYNIRCPQKCLQLVSVTFIKSFLCAERNKQLSHNVSYKFNTQHYSFSRFGESEYLESLCTIHLSHYCSRPVESFPSLCSLPSSTCINVLTFLPLCVIPLPCNAIKCTIEKDRHAVQDEVTPLIGAPSNGNYCQHDSCSEAYTDIMCMIKE